MDKRIKQGDYQIKSIGKLLDFATKDEVDKYYGSIVQVDDIKVEDDKSSDEEESNFII